MRALRLSRNLAFVCLVVMFSASRAPVLLATNKGCHFTGYNPGETCESYGFNFCTSTSTAPCYGDVDCACRDEHGLDTCVPYCGDNGVAAYGCYHTELLEDMGGGVFCALDDDERVWCQCGDA